MPIEHLYAKNRMENILDKILAELWFVASTFIFVLENEVATGRWNRRA